MKTYYNGPRQGMMYGGGVNMRKPMMDGGKVTKKKMNMGGLAQENRKRTTAQSSMNPMGDMTEQKKFSMGMMYGGQAKLDKNKDGKISGEDFKMMKKK
jgi:hypothetical protein